MKGHISKRETAVAVQKYEENKKYLEKIFRIFGQPYSDIQTLCIENKYNADYDFTLVKALVMAFSNLGAENLKRHREAKLISLSRNTTFCTQKVQELCKKPDFMGLHKEVNTVIRHKYIDAFTYRSLLVKNLSYLWLHFATVNIDKFMENDFERIELICDILTYEYFQYNLFGRLAIKPETTTNEKSGISEKDNSTCIKVAYFEDFSLCKDEKLNLFASLYDGIQKYLLNRKDETRDNILTNVFNLPRLKENMAYLQPVFDVLSLKDKYTPLENEMCNVLFNSICLNLTNNFEKSIEIFVQSVIIACVEYGYLKLDDTRNLENQDANSKIKDLKVKNRAIKKEIPKKDSEISKLQLEIDKNKKIVEEQVILKQTNKKIEDLETEVCVTKEKLVSLTSDYDKLKLKCQHQEQEINTLKVGLREFSDVETDMMYLQNENTLLKLEIDKLEDSEVDADVEQEEYNRKLKELADIPILFVGGVGNMMAKFKTLFPNSDYIDISNDGTSFVVPPRFQYVVIYTKMVSHAHCERIESQISNKKIIPINIFNTKLVVNEIYNVVCSE